MNQGILPLKSSIPLAMHVPLQLFASNFDWEFGRTTAVFLVWFRDSKRIENS